MKKFNVAIHPVILFFCRFLRNGCPGWIAMLFFLAASPGITIEPINPDQPVYQTNWLLPDWAVKTHPGMVEKQYTTPEEMVEIEKKRFGIMNRQKLMDLGLYFLGFGLPMVLIAFFASPLLKQYQYQMISHFLCSVGLGLASSGLVMRELARWYLVAPAAICLLVVYGIISHYRRDKGIEIKNPLKRKATKQKGTGTDAPE